MNQDLDLDEQPERPVRAVLALGSNLGDREATLRSAVIDLDGFEGVKVRLTSPVLETGPVGGPEQPDYLNAVVVVDTTLSALELLAACQQVEEGHGRVRTIHWGARTLDIDIITYDDLVASSHQLDLPHPMAAERAFVLQPWLELDPQAALPGPQGPQRVIDLLPLTEDRDDLRPRPDVVIEVPR